jgi:hypothetical protein
MAVWCPLQKLFMKSRCCVDCRIYGWGYFLVFGPLLLLPNFFTVSLAASAAALLVRWEIACARHPERFWTGSNAALRCESCARRHYGCKRRGVQRTDMR